MQPRRDAGRRYANKRDIACWRLNAHGCGTQCLSKKTYNMYVHYHQQNVLVHTSLWRDVLHIRIKRLHVYWPILNLGPVRSHIPVRNRVLHPFLIITLGEVFAGVCTPGFLALLSRVYGSRCIDEEVVQLHGLHQISVPHCRPVLQS